MSAFKPSFIYRSKIYPFSGVYDLTHEKPEELIQGGSPGEHYHLTEAEHTGVQSLLTVGAKIYEPVYKNFEPMFSSGGDIMMAWGGSYVAS